MEPRVIFEDNELLVLDKPAGMVVNNSETTKGGRTVQNWVEERAFARQRLAQSSQLLAGVASQYDFINRAGIVHRIDKETSGLLLIAKTPEAFQDLQRQFKERKVKKTYIALVHGSVKPEVGEIKVPIGRLPWNRKRFGVIAGGREAVTRYKILRYLETKILGKMTLIELYPETGRTHQIRVHLKSIGHPIVADEFYAGRKTARADRKWCPRLFLHASKIEFSHPASLAGGPKTGEKLAFECPFPEELVSVIKPTSKPTS